MADEPFIVWVARNISWISSGSSPSVSSLTRSLSKSAICSSASSMKTFSSSAETSALKTPPLASSCVPFRPLLLKSTSYPCTRLRNRCCRDGLASGPLHSQWHPLLSTDQQPAYVQQYHQLRFQLCHAQYVVRFLCRHYRRRRLYHRHWYPQYLTHPIYYQPHILSLYLYHHYPRLFAFLPHYQPQPLPQIHHRRDFAPQVDHPFYRRRSSGDLGYGLHPDDLPDIHAVNRIVLRCQVEQHQLLLCHSLRFLHHTLTLFRLGPPPSRLQAVIAAIDYRTAALERTVIRTAPE